MRRAERDKKIQCQHLHADSIHGDEINQVGKRGYCWSCRTWLDELPVSFHGTALDRLIRLGGAAWQPTS